MQPDRVDILSLVRGFVVSGKDDITLSFWCISHFNSCDKHLDIHTTIIELYMLE